ncbi:MAG: methyltransferase domain-containing protein [Acidobacteria bacterium]|nr:methyltransferase domain-containing protein [Acidobacteriota bacterium]
MPIEEFAPARLTHSQIHGVYSRLSPSYGIWEKIAERQPAELALELAAVGPGEKVLEVAVGPGNAHMHLARDIGRGTVGGATVVGADLTPAMLARTARRFRQEALPVPLLCRCDACSLPFADQSFDLVFCAYLLDLLSVESIAEALREMRRVLRPGGRLALVHLGMGHTGFNRIWGFFYWLIPTMLGGCRPIRVVPHLPALGFEVLQAREVLCLRIPSDVILARRVEKQ